MSSCAVLRDAGLGGKERAAKIVSGQHAAGKTAKPKVEAAIKAADSPR